MAAEGNYIDEDDVCNWVNGATEADKQAIIDQSERMIEKITHDLFYSKAETLIRDGNGKSRLFIGIPYDLLTVTAITIFGVAVDTDLFTFDKDSVYADTDADIGTVDPNFPFGSRIFTKGTNNVDITCTVGHATVPAAIKNAAIILCRYENDSTLYCSNTMNEMEKFGDSTIKRGKFMTGVLDADRLIYRYIKRKPVLGV